MQTQSFKISKSVEKREFFLQQEFKKSLYVPAKKQRVLRLISELQKRYGYTVVSFCEPFKGLTRENITSNNKYSLD